MRLLAIALLLWPWSHTESGKVTIENERTIIHFKKNFKTIPVCTATPPHSIFGYSAEWVELRAVRDTTITWECHPAPKK